MLAKSTRRRFNAVAIDAIKAKLKAAAHPGDVKRLRREYADLLLTQRELSEEEDGLYSRVVRLFLED